MKQKKLILILLFACLASSSHAQENRLNLKFQLTEIPIGKIKDKIINRTFFAPELRVDSTFINNLNAILFDGKCSIASDNSWKDFYVSIGQKDSLNYSVQVMLRKYPSMNSKGFFEQNGYFYWFGTPPPGIILGTGLKKQFSFDEYLSPGRDIDDPPLWFLSYNLQTGEMKENEWPFGY